MIVCVIVIIMLLQAHGTDERSKKRVFRRVSIVWNIISFVAIILVVIIVPVIITQAKTMQQ